MGSCEKQMWEKSNMKKIIILAVCLIMAFPVYAKNNGKYKKQKKMPPGLEKKLARTGELPPGWQKKIAKGQVLDLSLYKIGKPITNKHKGNSLKPEAGTELLQIDDRIIRVKKDTKEILDIIDI
jgi:hypothetical protein